MGKSAIDGSHGQNSRFPWATFLSNQPFESIRHGVFHPAPRQFHSCVCHLWARHPKSKPQQFAKVRGERLQAYLPLPFRPQTRTQAMAERL